MWISRLPDPQSMQHPDSVPSFRDNILLTEKLRQRYHYPEHRSPLGLAFQLQGRGKFILNGRTEILQDGVILLINAASRLAINITDREAQPGLLFFRAHLPAEVCMAVTRTAESLLDNPAGTACDDDFGWLERIHPLSATLAEKLQFLVMRGGGASSLNALQSDMIVRSILEHWISLNREAVSKSAKLRVVRPATRMEIYRRLSAAKDWIGLHYSEPVSLHTMASAACMNSHHFLRTFKQVYEITPHQFLIQKRLEASRQLLLAGQNSVHDICRQTGWESLSSFSWLFRRKYGVSPSALRRQAR